MKAICIICAISLCLGGLTFGSSVDFVSGAIDRIDSAYNLIKNIVGLPTAQRLDGSTVNVDANITNPNLNPNDNMTISQYLRYVQSIYNNDFNDFGVSEVQDIFNNVSDYMYIVRGRTLGQLLVDYQGYAQGSIVMMEYAIPCVKYVHNGINYYMLDPSNLNLSGLFRELSPFIYYARNLINQPNGQPDMDGYEYSNTIIEKDGVIYSIRGNEYPISWFYVDGLQYDVEEQAYYGAYLEQVNIKVVDHLNGDNRIDKFYNIVKYE